MLAHRPFRTPRPIAASALVVALAGASLFGLMSDRAAAAASAGCDGGGYSIVLPSGAVVKGDQATKVPASALGTSFLVKGKYIEFTVLSAGLGVRNWTFTGAPNPLDLTGGRRTVVFASKIPDH